MNESENKLSYQILTALLVLVVGLCALLGIRYYMVTKTLEIEQTRLSELHVLYANQQKPSGVIEPDPAIEQGSPEEEAVVMEIGGGIVLLEEINKTQGSHRYFIEPSTGMSPRETYLGKFFMEGKREEQKSRTKVVMSAVQPPMKAALYIDHVSGNTLSYLHTALDSTYEIGYNGNLHNYLSASFQKDECEKQGRAVIDGINWSKGSAVYSESKRIYTFSKPITVSCLYNEHLGYNQLSLFEELDESSLSSDLTNFDIKLSTGQKLHIQLPKQGQPTASVK